MLEQDNIGSSSYKIIKVTNRFDEHVADYSKDYIKIKELALKEKQLKTIQTWMSEKIIETYISVNKDSRECNFANKWLKNNILNSFNPTYRNFIYNIFCGYGNRYFH